MGYGSSQRTSRRVANSFNGINAAARTRWNHGFAVALEVRRQVIWKIDWVARLLIFLESELICGGINLAKIVYTGLTAVDRTRFDKIWNCYGRKEANNGGDNQNETAGNCFG